VSKLTLFHNPRCSKSRRALELLREHGADFEVVEYLERPPTRQAIESLIEASDSPAADFVRRGDAAFKEAGLSLSADADVAEVALLLAAHPRVLQRPIVAGGGKAVIGRPPERVLELL